jgi:hypothetical protein
VIPAALLAVLLTAGGQPPRAVVSPDLRVHLLVSEDLDPDSLSALGRPRAVLWLTTRSNTLRRSTARAVARFSEAWVEVRPPLSPAQVESFSPAPAAGLWLRGMVAPGDWISRLGVRRWAAEVQGPVPESLWRRRGLGRLGWAPGELDLASFGRATAAGVPLTLLPPAGRPPPECAERWPSAGRVTVRAAGVAEGRAWARCGFRVRLPVPPTITDEALVDLLRLMPLLELEVEVGADDRRALAARRLLERLEAPGRGSP